MRDVDRYLDRVMEAFDQHPTWDADELLRHVFKTWAGLDAEDFIQQLKDEIERDYEAQRRRLFS